MNKHIYISAFSIFASLGPACGDNIEDSGYDQITAEIVENLMLSGFPESDIQVLEEGVYVGWDARVTLEASREMVEHLNHGDIEEQYRTTNLVTNAGTICINGRRLNEVAGDDFGLLSTGLDQAIENYNELNLSINFRRISGDGTGDNGKGCDAVIAAKVDNNGAGGIAGFPFDGKPYDEFFIGVQTATEYDQEVVTHVITHELGHCIGFRHSDYFDRSISCGGDLDNEGQGEVGAVLIEGTPSDATEGGSLMNSCFRPSEDGEFTDTDITALQVMYPL